MNFHLSLCSLYSRCKQIYELIEQENQVCTANPFKAYDQTMSNK